MPRRRQHDPTRVRIGLLLIAVLVSLALGVFFVDLAVRATAEGARITVIAESAPGLRPGSPVWVAGRPIGRVLSIEFRPAGAVDGSLLIRAALDRAAQSVLGADASAEILAPDLLGPVVVAIDPGSGDAARWNFADTLRTSDPPLDPEALMALADSLFAAGRRLQERAGEARLVLTTGAGSVQRLTRDPGVSAGIRSALADLEETIERAVPGSTLTRLATDTLIVPATTRIRERLTELAAAPEREASRRSLEEARSAMDSMSDRLESVIRRVQSGEGTAGRALLDRELARQLDVLRTTLGKLAEDLAYEPGRWLRVRVF